MFKLRFALALLLSTGNGAFADTSDGWIGVSDPEPGANNQDAVQESSPPSALMQNAYNSEDYVGEPYEDNRIRLMLNPKKTITLNETNLRTWKVNPVTTSRRDVGVSEAFQIAPRSSFTVETTANSKRDEGVSASASSVVVTTGNNSAEKQPPEKPPVNTPPQTVNQSSIDVTKQASPPAGAMGLPQSSNVGESPVIAEDSQASTPVETTTIREESPTPHTGLVIIETKTSSGDTSYVDIETDYNEELANDDEEEEERATDAPDSNSYVILLPGGKGQSTNFGKNISSIKPEIISDNLLYMLFNLTASSAMNQRNEKKILKELSEQKKQINDVDAKLNNIYELLKKPN